MKKSITRVKTSLKNSFQNHPLITFVTGLAILLGLIILANFIRTPAPEEDSGSPEVKVVETYNIGAAPKAQFQGRVEKTGVITIVAQSSGVVRNIAVKPGDTVNKGRNLLSLSTNYQGANLASVQRQIAQKSYFLSKDTLDQQKDIISKQLEVVSKEHENKEELRKITERSLRDTRGLLDLNEEILETTNQKLEKLEVQQTASPSASTQEMIEGLKQAKAGQLAAVNQLKQQVRSSRYDLDENNAPIQIQEINKDIATKQLEIQEKTLELNHQVAYLNYRIAQISESLMYPAAPFMGTVERVHVRVGQVVNPGDTLVSLTGDVQHLTVVASVPENIAKNISPLDASVIMINGHEYSTVPLHISSEATNGNLFSIMYDVPEQYATQVSDNSVVTIKVPIGFADTSGVVPAVPIDIIHQLQDKSYVYIIRDGKAVSKEVKLGKIYGAQVQILEGLESGEAVIINRNVIEGDLVQAS